MDILEPTGIIDVEAPDVEVTTCPICGSPVSPEDLPKVLGLPAFALNRLRSEHPGWEPAQGACPNCVRSAMVQVLIAQAQADEQEKTQVAGPLNAESVFGVLPTPMRLQMDARYRGRGITLAMVDAAFYPHPDLVQPHNRIRAWVDATVDEPEALYFDEDSTPEWPGWDSNDPSQWHGLMTSSTAAGNGWLSQGVYRGLASEAELVLLQTRGADGHISNENITRALHWLLEHHKEMGVRVVSMSVSGDHVSWLAGNPVDAAIAQLVSQGVVVVVAAGNSGVRELVPPATAPDALTIGGLDDRNNFDEQDIDVWHSNYGESVSGLSKPELVAPSIWVVAPVLPTSEVAKEAQELFAKRAEGDDEEVEFRIAEQKLITPNYQHVEGTSFAAPVVASVVCCMLEANLALTPRQVRGILIGTAQPVEGVQRERQGAGAVVPSLALGMALRQDGGPLVGFPMSPQIEGNSVTVSLYDTQAHEVAVQGSWDDWSAPGIPAEQVQPGVWVARVESLPAGRHTYRFLLDGERWLDDPDNPRKEPNTFGTFDSIIEIEAAESQQAA